MKRKLLSIALALCMVLGMMPTALAGEVNKDIAEFNSAQLNADSSYTLSHNSKSNATITMADDAKNVVFDLNGYTWNGTITVKSGTELTIMDSSKNGTGTVKQPQADHGQQSPANAGETPSFL